MIPFRRVYYRDAESYIKHLKETGELLGNYKIKREGDYILVPCTTGDERGDFERNEKIRLNHVGSFERIADFYVIKEREGWENVFDEIINKQKPRAIFLDRGVTGTERKRNVVRVYGTGPPQGIHKENGIRLMVNIEKAYYSPRLGGIRWHILSNVMKYKHDKVIDMYAGIGPISIILLKNDIKTFSFDINADAISLLKENFKMNHVNGNIALADSNSLASCFKDANQVIMNNPTQPKRISSEIINNFKRDTIIHFFIVKKKDEELDFANIKILENKEVHGYSPSLSLYYYLIQTI